MSTDARIVRNETAQPRHATVAAGGDQWQDESKQRCLVLVALPDVAQARMVAKKQWRDLNPRLRQVITLGAAFEASLKVAALTDLAQRPRHGLRGSKAGWAAAITLINSVGVVPILYLLLGRAAVSSQQQPRVPRALRNKPAPARGRFPTGAGFVRGSLTRAVGSPDER